MSIVKIREFWRANPHVVFGGVLKLAMEFSTVILVTVIKHSNLKRQNNNIHFKGKERLLKNRYFVLSGC